MPTRQTTVTREFVGSRYGLCCCSPKVLLLTKIVAVVCLLLALGVGGFLGARASIVASVVSAAVYVIVYILLFLGAQCRVRWLIIPFLILQGLLCLVLLLAVIGAAIGAVFRHTFITHFLHQISFLDDSKEIEVPGEPHKKLADIHSRSFVVACVLFGVLLLAFLLQFLFLHIAWRAFRYLSFQAYLKEKGTSPSVVYHAKSQSQPVVVPVKQYPSSQYPAAYNNHYPSSSRPQQTSSRAPQQTGGPVYHAKSVQTR